MVKRLSSTSKSNKPSPSHPSKPKKVRLSHLSQGKRISTRAKSQLLREVKAFGLPEALSESTGHRERQKLVYQTTEYGPVLVSDMLPTRDGGTIKVFFQNPFATLAALIKHSVGFMLMFQTMLAAAQNRLQVVIYNDEVTPGQQLNKRNRRKTLGVYWTFLEWMFPKLSDERFWFCLTSVRSSTVNKIKGGVACIYKHAMWLFFGGRNNDKPDFRLGVMFGFESTQSLVFASLAVSVADERALKACNHCKGATGTKCCLVCQNVLFKGSSRLPDTTGFCFSVAELDPKNFVPQTNGMVDGILARLAAVDAAGDTKALDVLQEELGWIHVDTSWLVCKQLSVKVIDINHFDWMHCLVESGAYDLEAAVLEKSLTTFKLGCEHVDKYFDLFEWPKAYATARECFSEGKFVASASECLSVALLFAKYLVDMVASNEDLEEEVQLQAEVKSMLACTYLLLLCNSAVRGGLDPGLLLTAVLSFWTFHQAAYGDSLWKPKHHFLYHLVGQLQRHGALFATFVQERKHRMIKMYAEARRSSQSFDRGMLEEVTASMFYDFSGSVFETGIRIIDAVTAPPSMVQALVAAGKAAAGENVSTGPKLVVNDRTCCKGDVVEYTSDNGSLRVGMVHFHFETNNTCFTTIAHWPTTRQDKFARYCTVQQNSEVIVSARITEACVYSRADDGELSQVLLPFCRSRQLV